MAKLYEAHERVTHGMARNALSPLLSRPGSRVNSKSGRISVTVDKKIVDDEFMAAALGDTEWLRQSLRGSKGIVHFDNNGLAPIHLAAVHGRLESLKLLIEKLKVDVNLPSTTGWRAIHLVISSQTGKRAFNCLLYLLKRGADHSVCNGDGLTPMHQAASEGHVQCLKALISVGAVIDGLDVRNHKPIDLAKLWGHRKCARILATEMWHKEKDHVAKQMKQLEKLKMHQILQEIEQEEQHEAYLQFYGGIAFNNWKDKKGIVSHQIDPAKSDRSTPKSTKKPQKIKRENERSSPSRRKMVYSTEPTITEENESARETPKSILMHKPMNSYPQSVSSTAKQGMSPSPTGEEMDWDEMQKENPDQMELDEPVQAETRWNLSTRLPPKSYITDLTDYYPRDEYTKLPKYPLKKGDPVKPQVPLPEKRLLSSASSKKPNLPEDVIQNALVPPKERPVMYKPIAIMDVHKRKHYTEDERPQKSEAGMHFTNDINSRLFKSCLCQPSHQVPPSASSSTTTGSNASQKSSSFDLRESYVPKLMKQMHPPSHYPAIQGEEYVLNTNSVAGV